MDSNSKHLAFTFLNQLIDQLKVSSEIEVESYSITDDVSYKSEGAKFKIGEKSIELKAFEVKKQDKS